jgi:hypothetical protein
MYDVCVCMMNCWHRSSRAAHVAALVCVSTPARHAASSPVPAPQAGAAAAARRGAGVAAAARQRGCGRGPARLVPGPRSGQDHGVRAARQAAVPVGQGARARGAARGVSGGGAGGRWGGGAGRVVQRAGTLGSCEGSCPPALHPPTQHHRAAGQQQGADGAADGCAEGCAGRAALRRTAPCAAAGLARGCPPALFCASAHHAPALRRYLARRCARLCCAVAVITGWQAS